MKIKFLILSFLLISNTHASGILDASFCKSYYKRTLATKKIKLFSIYESNSLCGFEMDANTIGFNLDGAAPNQELTKSEKELLQYNGRWINIFSKDPSRPVVEETLSELGIPNEFGCLSEMPQRKYIQCPLKGKNVFKIITEFKKENSIQVKTE